MFQDFQFMITAFVIVLIAVMAVTILGRILQSLFLAVVVVLTVSLGFTLVFGDGREIVQAFTSFLNEDVGQKIEEGYDYYKSKEEQDQYLDPDKITDYATNVFSDKIEKFEFFREENKS